MPHFSSKFGCSGPSRFWVSSPDYYYHICPENTAACSTETHQRDGCLQNSISWQKSGHWWGELEANQGATGKWSCYSHMEMYGGVRIMRGQCIPSCSAPCLTRMHCGRAWEYFIRTRSAFRFYCSFSSSSCSIWHFTHKGDWTNTFFSTTFRSPTLQKGFLQESLALSQYNNSTFCPLSPPLPLSV